MKLPPFASSPAPPAPDYAKPGSWAALPTGADTADATPAGLADHQADAPADVFYIHPTTYLQGPTWNAAIDEEKSSTRLDEVVVKAQASAFNGCCRVFAPRYRQVHLLGFVGPNAEEAPKALAIAYEDVRAAFAYYLKTWNKDRPIVIASHSQGSRFALWLVQDVIEKDPKLLERFVAGYILGYAIPLDVYDRTLSIVKPCRSISDTRCILNWSTYAEGFEAGRSREVIHRYPGNVWEANGDKPLQCNNPLMWTEGATPEWAPASLHKGALAFPEGDAPLPALVAGEVSARCHDGGLFVTMAKTSPFASMHRDGNYHNQDIGLFYGNVRENAAARVEAFVRGAHLGQVIDLKHLVPKTSFDEMPVPPAPDYANPISWGALPWRLDFADFAPKGESDNQAMADVDVFFLYPTTFLFDEGWNSPIDHAVATARVDQGVLKHQASAFSGCCRIFAPRYRQATLVSFFPNYAADGQKAQELAYGDVKQAFAYYLEHYNEGRPFILASHSQGTRHLIALLADVLAKSPARERLVAAYAIGYPLPLAHYGGDYGDIVECRAADDTDCVVNYGTYGEGGPPPPGKNASFQCSNPLSWDDPGAKAPASKNLGALVGAVLHDPIPATVPGRIGAQCRDGTLWADVPEDSRWYALRQKPNNYHNQDYSLFYMNLRENAAVRVAAYKRAHDAN
ncbi:MAG: DUF3089 domain-containing protein [Alphaproteobacteria bacterium]|nr:DUF3089 domain-containing protein [Alphaproteobacteria bacterium]